MKLFQSPSPLEVWAVDDRSVQLTWGNIAPGEIEVVATTPSGETRSTVEVHHGGGPGSVVVGNLVDNAAVSLAVRHPDGQAQLQARTLARPPGKELAHFATISDLHLGAKRWGLFKTMSEDPNAYSTGHPTRCATSAINDALAWGAEYLIIKGDAANHATKECFDELGYLVDQFVDLPMMLLPGNHDVETDGIQTPVTVGKRRLPYVRHVDEAVLDGVRIVGADTTRPGHGRGTLSRVGGQILEQVGTSDRPVFLAIHQQLQPGRIVRHWPPGIAAPSSTTLLDGLERCPQPIFVSSGHTHRNRTRSHGSTLLTEVASTKDYPGVWASYRVFEGGIIQSVWRASAPEAMAWTEYSRNAVGGLWGKWSPGPIEQRCLSHRWPDSTS